MLRIRDLETCRIVRHVGERERRIAVGAESCVRVERNAPRPAQDAEVEVEDAAGIAPGEEDREERDHRQNEERKPEEREHDVVRDREDPLHEPQPAAQFTLELALDSDGIRWVFSLLFQSVHSYTPDFIGARGERTRTDVLSR